MNNRDIYQAYGAENARKVMQAIIKEDRNREAQRRTAFSEIDANGIVAPEGSSRVCRAAGKGGMFTIIRKFRLMRGSAVEVSRRVREGFVPLLQGLPGFRGYYSSVGN